MRAAWRKHHKTTKLISYYFANMFRVVNGMLKSLNLSKEAINKIEAYRKQYGKIPSFSHVVETLILNSNLQDTIHNQTEN